MNERICWNCGHFQEQHTTDGGCSFAVGEERCDCPRYEDSEYSGEQRKRDMYRNSDPRRQTAARRRR
ncbi:MAG TPA: hypothetical protein VF754_09520 [Pyrinomonadaceae bacterium]